MRGFTLIELLVTISIMAVLSSAVVFFLNPAELIKQARDAKRIADLKTTQTAILTYLATASLPDLNSIGSGMIGRCMENTQANNSPFSIVVPTTYGCGSATGNITSRVVTGAGWVSIDLTQASIGSPLAILPQDPDSNTADGVYFYAYAADDVGPPAANVFELNARLESVKYRDKMMKDGGDRSICTTWTSNDCWYETGNAPGLSL